MVILAQENSLQRANYAELEQASQPQVIASLMPQVLARYALVAADVRLPETTKAQRSETRRRTARTSAPQLFS
ncbi:hypothetical protein NA78x_001991 [Anatilimnocola sp. NA78]|uniref:hypothetical protein n=1 Tax=Anatilimnocola sp. NA78 TaxID=3415683 RepID=UPI003CE53E0D